MLTDEDLEKIAMLLEAYGLKKVTSLKNTQAAERQRRFRERRNAASNAKVTQTQSVKRNAKSNGEVTHEAPTNATWRAYAEAYERRWGAAPMRNRTVNGQLAQFVTRIPTDEAPMVAAFFVQSNRGLYVAAKHPVNLLLRNAEALRTEWATGNAGTETEARQADRTQATGNAFAPLIAEAQERAKRGTH